MPNTITTKIREKYPQYQNLSEEELTLRIGERYPAYLKHEDFKSEFDTFKMRRDPPPSMRALVSVFPQIAPRAPVTEPTPFREERAPATFETRLPELGTAERIEAVKSAEGAGLLEVAKVVKDIALSPMADIPPEVVAVTPLAQQVKTLFGEEAAVGVSEGLAGFASTITAPATIPALAVAGAGAVPSAVIGGLFALDAILNTPEKARQLAESIVKGDRREIARNLVESAGVAAQAVGGGAVVPRAFRRAATPAPEAPPVLPRVEPPPEPISPLGTLPPPETITREPAGLEIAREPSRPEPAGGLVTTEPTLGLIPEGLAEVPPGPEFIPAGVAEQRLRLIAEAESRGKDFGKAVAEKVSQQQTEAAQTIIHPNKPLTDNQLRIMQDSLRQAVLDNQIPGDRPGIIVGSGLEAWADGVISEGGKRLNVGIDPELMAAYAVKGAALLEKGVTNLHEWTNEMVKAFGPEIKPFIASIRKSSEDSRASVFIPLQKREQTRPTAGLRLQREPPLAPSTPTTVRRPTSPVGDQPLPDFLSKSDTQFGEAFGIGRIPFFGRLFDPAKGADTPLGKAVLGYFAERHGVGPAFASRFGELIRGLEDPFEINKTTGDITNIGAPEGASLKISDVFEALKRDPDSYELNAEQRAAFEKIQALERDFNELEARNQIGRSIDDEIGAFEEIVDTQQQPEAYFPRIVIERPKPKRIGTGQSFGAKQFFEKSRLFETEQEGWAKGYRYEPSIEKRLVTRAERLYKRIADKRFSENSALVSKTRAELDAQLRHQYAEELASGEMTEAKLGQIGDSITASGRVNVPAFQNKIFDIEIAQFLEKALKNPTSEIRKMLVKLNNAGKTLFLGFDLGNFFIQLLPTFFSNPVKWGKSVVEGISALGTSKRFSAYVRDNQQAVRELAEHGSSVGRLPEFLAGFEEGELVTRIPVVGQVAKAFGRQFNTALDVAKVELWKAYREVTPRDQWTDTVRGIEAQLMSGRMESAGVSANRALTERAFFLAPAYYRGALDLVGNLTSKRVSGSITRRSLGAYIAVGSALFYGIGQLLKQRGDMTEKEIQERFNPAHPAFMMWKVNVDGKPVNVGFGGIYKSLVKLVANTYKTSVEHPENWKSLSPDQNPLVRWARGHAAPIPSIAFDQFTGRDFLGRDTDVTAVAPRLLPMAVQAAIPKEGEQAPTAFEPIATFFGLSVFPESMRKRVEAEQQRLAQEMFKKDYGQLNIRDQEKIVKKIKANPEFDAPTPTALMTQRAIKAEVDRTKRVAKGVSKDNQEWLKEHSLEVRGYRPTVTISGTEMPLTEEQRKKYEALIIDEYNTSLDKIRDTKLAVPPDKLQRFLDERLEESRARAKTKLINQQP